MYCQRTDKKNGRELSGTNQQRRNRKREGGKEIPLDALTEGGNTRVSGGETRKRHGSQKEKASVQTLRNCNRHGPWEEMTFVRGRGKAPQAQACSDGGENSWVPQNKVSPYSSGGKQISVG